VIYLYFTDFTAAADDDPAVDIAFPYDLKD